MNIIWHVQCVYVCVFCTRDETLYVFCVMVGRESSTFDPRNQFFNVVFFFFRYINKKVDIVELFLNSAYNIKMQSSWQ